MIEKYLEVESLSVIIIGDFNPVIFQPYWLAKKELIREEEAANAKVEIISNEFVRYELSDWLNFQITRNQCIFRTRKEPYFDPLKDLIISIFKILKETPIKAIGINNTYDLSLKTQENYYKFGNCLTPLSFWNEDLNDPRLLSLDIVENNRKETPNAKRRVGVRPSSLSINFGVAINVNNHYEVSENTSSLELLEIIENNWDNSFIESKKLIETLLSKINFNYVF